MKLIDLLNAKVLDPNSQVILDYGSEEWEEERFYINSIPYKFLQKEIILIKCNSYEGIITIKLVEECT